MRELSCSRRLGLRTVARQRSETGIVGVVEGPEVRRADDQIVVVLEDGESVRSMRRDVLGSLQGRPRDLVIDLRKVDHLSNPGLALLVGVRARQRARQCSLTLVCASDSATEQILSRTGLRGRFTTVTSIASNSSPTPPQPGRGEFDDDLLQTGAHVIETRKAD